MFVRIISSLVIILIHNIKDNIPSYKQVVLRRSLPTVSYKN